MSNIDDIQERYNKRINRKRNKYNFIIAPKVDKSLIDLYAIKSEGIEESRRRNKKIISKKFRR
jgi:hypothetical protein